LYSVVSFSRPRLARLEGDHVGRYFTKPLQCSIFRGFRNAILGINEDEIPSYNAETREMIESPKDG
jgi:hypothetical protein